MTFQKEKTLPFVGYFLLLSKKSWKLSIYEHVESIPEAVPLGPHSFLKKDIYCRYISQVSVQEKVDYTWHHAWVTVSCQTF